MFNYNHLYYFYETARLGGVTKAAQVLRIAQPSLSIQLKTLEKELDTVLFKKVGRRLQLTLSGERVYGFCQKMFEAANELDGYLKHSSGRDIQRWQVGVSPEVERPFIADVLSGLMQSSLLLARPQLSLIAEGHKELIRRLTGGSIDLAVTNQEEFGPQFVTLAELKMPVFAVINSKTLKRKYIHSYKNNLSKFLQESNADLVLPSESQNLRLQTDLYMEKHKIRNPIVLESDILSVVVRAVMEGVGIGFLPYQYIKKDLQEKRLICLEAGKPLWFSKIFLIARKSKQINPVNALIKGYFAQL